MYELPRRLRRAKLQSTDSILDSRPIGGSERTHPAAGAPHALADSRPRLYATQHLPSEGLLGEVEGTQNAFCCQPSPSRPYPTPPSVLPQVRRMRAHTVAYAGIMASRCLRVGGYCGAGGANVSRKHLMSKPLSPIALMR